LGITFLKGGDISVSPPYSSCHSGPCIVAGSASCLFDDLKRVQEKYNNLPIIAVNGASKLVSAIALYSRHPERFIERRWLESHRFFFGDEASVHADILATKKPTCVDYWWTGTWGGGGSAWGARKLAAYLGFDLVILCGCPLVAGPHIGGLSFASFMHDEDVIKDLRHGIEKEPEWHDGARSMSGWTAEILGLP